MDKKQDVRTGPVDVLHTIQSQAPQPVPIPGGGWPSSSQNNEKQSLRDRPIVINAAALAQAEQSDGEYIRMLKDILLGINGRGSDGQTLFVPVDQQGRGQPNESGARRQWT